MNRQAANPDTEPPGWHGKLPSLGDFASRRLTPEFLGIWDTWLAAGLQKMREDTPEAWLEAYLASPSRRFLLMPGALQGEAADKAWAGVLMPSVDRVGRYFPFTIIQAIEPPASVQQMQSLWFWLGRLDELAADAMQDDWPIDRLEAELGRMAGPDLEPLRNSPVGLPQNAGDSVTAVLPAGRDITQHIGIEAQALWHQRAWGLAYWYTATDPQAPGLVISRGLPATAAGLLGATM